MDNIANKKEKIRILRSDLADTKNPKIISRYPHLDSEQLREQLCKEIAALEVDL